MSDITEGLGGAVEGALAGRAVEPRRGETDGTDASAEKCLNCGAVPGGAFCQHCGQKQHIHRSLSAIFHDLIHGVLHLDGKVWRTLPLLIFKPGQLTRRYIEGERARFVSPMAMFLFSVFLMFAVFQMVGLTTPTDVEGDARAQVTKLVEAERKAVTDQIAQIDEELASEEIDDERRATLETRRDTLNNDLAVLDTRGQNLTTWLTSGSTEFLDTLQSSGEDQIADAKQRLEAMEVGSQEHTDLAAEIATAERGISELKQFEELAEESSLLVQGDDGSLKVGNSGIGFIDSALEKWNNNPSLMLYKLQANGYKFSWLLIPLSIPFVWLLFLWRRGFKAYDHAVFVTYSLSFMSLLFITISLMAATPVDINGGWAFALFAIGAPLHVYKHLRHAYGLSRFSTLWRFFALLVFIVLVLILFLQALLLLGAF